MRYRVEISGRIFEGDDVRTLLRRAVQAKQATAPSSEEVPKSPPGSQSPVNGKVFHKFSTGVGDIRLHGPNRRPCKSF